MLETVALGTLRAVPLALGRHQNVDTLKVEPLQPAVGRVAPNHLRHLVVRTLAVAVQLLRVCILSILAVRLLIASIVFVIITPVVTIVVLHIIIAVLILAGRWLVEG